MIEFFILLMLYCYWKEISLLILALMIVTVIIRR